MKTLNVVLIGAGSRGQAYTNFMTGDEFKVIAVAEPLKERREYIKTKHNISDEMCFNSWVELLSMPKLADVAIISTQDRMHYEPAMKAISLGYNLLLEKPAAPTAKECLDIASAAKEKGVKILVCHVLRYTPFFSKIKELILEDKLGKVISVHHNECVGNVHQSHSYVRGNWHSTEKSSNMLLAKSCHDIDIIQWIIDSKCTKTQSFGSLSYFTKENAPDGAPDYCIDGCPYGEQCYYNAVKLYLESENDSWYDWFRDTATRKVSPSDEEVENALRNTQYGKCVFKCENDVVDHQVVNMESENGATASFNMCAFNKGGRNIRVMGTKGEIYGDMENDIIDLFDFSTREHTVINPASCGVDGSLAGGHGGGDKGILDTLHQYLTEGYDAAWLSEIGISVENHLATFAAEASRLENKVIDVEEYKASLL